MKIQLDFAIDRDFSRFEEFERYVKSWERSASKNRRFSGVKVVGIEKANKANGWPTVTFEGDEDALKKLFLYYSGLSKKEYNKDIEDEFAANIVSNESKKELNEIDYGQNTTRRKHFKAADKNDRYWIYASDTDLSFINFFVKIDWERKTPYLAPVKNIDDTVRTDLKPFMTEDPAKIHSVALMVSKKYPKYWFSIQSEAYRETTLSRFNNTARPAGIGIHWDPKVKAWLGGIDEKLPPPEPISKKDDLFKNKETKEKNKYEKMDKRALPAEKTKVEKEIERTKKTIEDIKKSGNKSGKQEKFEKELERLKLELSQIDALLN